MDVMSNLRGVELMVQITAGRWGQVSIKASWHCIISATISVAKHGAHVVVSTGLPAAHHDRSYTGTEPGE